jgi:hypothetical protein
MPFCTNCGSEVDQLPSPLAVAQTVNDDVRIAEIQAERDVEVERIRANAAKRELETAAEIAETEAGAQVATAVAEAEVIGEIIAENGAPDDLGDPGPPIVIDPGPPDEDPEDPPRADESGSEPPAARKKSTGLGMW